MNVIMNDIVNDKKRVLKPNGLLRMECVTTGEGIHTQCLREF